MKQQSEEPEVGWWTINGFTPEQVAGVLQRGSRTNLILLDRVDEEEFNATAPRSWEVSGSPVMIGALKHNRYVSVLSAECRGQRYFPTPKPITEFQLHAFAEGRIPIPQSFELRYAEFEISGLAEWITGSLFAKMNDDGTKIEVDTKAEAVDSLSEGHLQDGCIIGLNRISETSQSGRTGLWYKERIKLQLHNPSRIPFDRMHSVIQRASEWVMLITGMHETHQKLSISDGKHSDIDLAFLRSWDYENRFRLPSKEKDERSSRRSIDLISFKESADNTLQLLANWIDNYDQYRAIYDAYFSILRGSSTHIESRFLNHVRAIEAYHRAVYPDSRHIDDKSFQAWVDSIDFSMFTSKLSSSKKRKRFKSHINDLLKNLGNRHPLQVMIDNVIDRYGTEFKNKLIAQYCEGTQENYHNTLALIANTRNKWSHGNPSRDQILQPENGGLFEAIFMLQRVHVCILLEITGFSPVEAANHIKNLDPYFWA